MRVLCSIALFCFLSGTSLAQGVGAGGADGDWVFRMVGDPTPQRVTLVTDGDSIRGRVYGYPFAGTLDGDALSFRVGSYSWMSRLDGDRLVGSIEVAGESSQWTGKRYRPPAVPRAFEYEPAKYHRLLSARTEPALRIFPGDTVRTTTVDAAGWSIGGYRERGNRVTAGGNPLTGPFYVEGTLPGDVLAVRLLAVHLNRDWAYSGDAVMSNVLDATYIREREVEGDLIQWVLDTEAGVARLKEPSNALANYEVPLSPFLGSIAVVPGEGVTPSSRDSGPFGGNMEYAEVREGATVYLPVWEEGAFLYLGDGHAVQGDGEVTGDALETSMDVAFTVDVLRYRFRNIVRVETPESMSSIGIAGSLDHAIQKATSDMTRWLESEFGLSSTEAALILGTVLEYEIPDVVLPWVSVVARVGKDALARINN